ncbi:MAG: M28 family peptidase [Acidobacteriota bacterium]
MRCAAASLLALAIACGLGLVAAPDARALPGEGVEVDRIRRDLRALADDSMEGRRSGEAGAERAAAFIAQAMREAGLEPALPGGYLQRFEVTTGVHLGHGNRLRVRVGETVLEGMVGRDFLPLAFSRNGRFSGRVVFAGYGITSRDPDYDDYAGLDTSEAAAVVLRHEPQERRKDSPFAGLDLSHHAGLRTKASNARRHGAAALLLVNDALGHAREEDVLLRLSYEGAAKASQLLVAHVRRQWIEQLPRGTIPKIRRWQKRVDRTLAPDSRPLPGVQIELEVDLEKERRGTANVLGILRGSDPELRRQVVLLGAHYDHLGRGGHHSLEPDARGQIHNGADDNASGVSALLEIARALARRRSEIGRSVLFAAFAGEEMGLLGSSHYVSNPALPLERTVAMINLDMVGRSREGRLNVGGVGSSPRFEALVRRLNEPYGLSLQLSSGGFGPSDHTPFYARQIPVLFFFTGAHRDYHRPSDDARHINYESLVRITGLVTDLARDLAEVVDAPVFTEVPDEPRSGGEGYGGRGYGAYLGSIPDFGESAAPGVTLTGVRKGSPAERAGLRGGDRIVRLGSLPIDNLYDLTYALRSYRSGERLKLRFIRDGRKIESHVVLGVRP